MKNEVKIKTEYKPERCEICHKSDYFNPINNHCSRCSNINIEKIKQDKVVRNNITESSIIDDWILCSTNNTSLFKKKS